MGDFGDKISFRLYFKILYFYILIPFEGLQMKGLSYEYPMYFGATIPIFKMAKELRKEETEAEKMLWKKLNKNQIMRLHFRRQHPINMFIC